jgi:predicted ATPase/DNA-binding CsgD family transcriptional regulator
LCTLTKIRLAPDMILPHRILHFVQNDKMKFGRRRSGFALFSSMSLTYYVLRFTLLPSTVHRPPSIPSIRYNTSHCAFRSYQACSGFDMADADPIDTLAQIAGERQTPPPNNLPAQLTTLLGRDQDVPAARALLQRTDVRLMTLTGPGGVGKTRLALRVAADVLWDFEGGVFFINLAPVSDPHLVLQAIAQTVDLREGGDLPLLTELADRLAVGRTLLVLDNFEQVIDAGPTLVDLLRECPGLKLLVTSRATLKVSGEHEYAVQPLAVPSAEYQVPSTKYRVPSAPESLGTRYLVLGTVPSVALFVRRARAVRGDFALTAENAAAVSEICARLDGLPLAIELAAAHVKSLTPQALLARLDKRLPLLVGGPRDLPARQRTLRSTMEWSYGLLDEDARHVFRHMGVFVGGCTLEATEQVCPGGEPFAQIESLLDASLLSRVDGKGGEPRYGMLETVREYALGKLEAEGESGAAYRGHARYFLALAETADAKLMGGEQGEWLERLEADHDNLLAALAWMMEPASEGMSTPVRDPEGALRLAGALWRFWYMRGYLSEGRRWLSRVPADDTSLPVAARAMALNGAGVLAYSQGDLEVARSFFERSLALRREIGDQMSIAASLNNLGAVAVSQADYEAAAALHGEALEIRRALDDKSGVASSLSNLGSLYIITSEYDRSITYQEQALQIRRDLGDKWGEAISLTNMGGLEVYRGNLERAVELHEESLKLRQELGDKAGIAISLNNLGRAVLAQGNVARAKSLLESSVALRLALGDEVGMIDSLEGLAGVALGEQQPRRAGRLLGAVESLREATGTPRTPAEMETYNSEIAQMHSSLGERVFEGVWVEGRALSPEQALNASDAEPVYIPDSTTAPRGAVQTPAAPGHATAMHAQYPAGLTEREVQVLRCVSFGLTSNQVAEKLIISPLTVNVHLRSIYSKLGVNSRTAAVRFAVDHKLI